jgi:hypothetical protein
MRFVLMLRVCDIFALLRYPLLVEMWHADVQTDTSVRGRSGPAPKYLTSGSTAVPVHNDPDAHPRRNLDKLMAIARIPLHRSGTACTCATFRFFLVFSVFFLGIVDASLESFGWHICGRLAQLSNLSSAHDIVRR